MFQSESAVMTAEAPATGNHQFVAGISPAMRALERVITDIAPTNIPVLLLGESGTGKEVVAMHIHRLSRRCHQAFVKVSCPTLTAEELNGGWRARGNGNGTHAAGSILLDEISELDAQWQPKLLNLLPDSYEPEADARILSATRRSLEEEMHQGRFREELYYRINGVCLRLPPLRHRREDIPLLADHFLDRYAVLYERPRRKLGTATLRTLQAYSWPGNVRELENVIKKIVALGDEGLALADLGTAGSDQPAGNGSPEAFSLKEAARAASRQAERQLILKVLTRTRWNRKRAAQELQISYKALLYKLKQIGLNDSAAV